MPIGRPSGSNSAVNWSGLNRSAGGFFSAVHGVIRQANILSAAAVQKPPASAIDEDAEISFQPDAAIGFSRLRSNMAVQRSKHASHQQTANKTSGKLQFFLLPTAFAFWPLKLLSHAVMSEFADGPASQSETHSRFSGRQGCRSWYVRWPGLVRFERRCAHRAVHLEIER